MITSGTKEIVRPKRYIDSIKADKGIVTINIAIGTVFEGEDAKYQILAIATDKP